MGIPNRVAARMMTAIGSLLLVHHLYTNWPSRERVGVALLLGASLLIGLCPWLLTNHINGSLQLLINRLPN